MLATYSIFIKVQEKNVAQILDFSVKKYGKQFGAKADTAAKQKIVVIQLQIGELKMLQERYRK